MDNTVIEQRLERIERVLLGQKDVLNFEEFCEYVGISKSYGYKLTSRRVVPYYNPNGKIIYFKKEEVDKWLLSNKKKATYELSEGLRKKVGVLK